MQEHLRAHTELVRIVPASTQSAHRLWPSVCVCVLHLTAHMWRAKQKQRWVYSTPPPVASGGLQPRFLAELTHNDANHNKKSFCWFFKDHLDLFYRQLFWCRAKCIYTSSTPKKLPNTGGLKKAVWKGKTALYREKLALRRENLWAELWIIFTALTPCRSLPHLLAWMHTLWAPCSFNYKCFYSD